MQKAQKALGIDIGKDFIVVAQAAEGSRLRWQTWTIHYAETTWWKQLIELIPDGAFVAAEPTGWHLLAPVATVINHYTTADLWLANADSVKAARSRFTNTKTDEMDARALALIAELIAQDDPPLGTRRYDSSQARAVLDLRLHVNAYARATRSSTRAKNQIEVFLHSVWPSLARSKTTWLRLAEQGYYSPADIRQAAAELAASYDALRATGWDGRQLRYIDALANTLPPDLPVNPTVILTIQEILEQLSIAQSAEKLHADIIAQTIRQPPFSEVTRRWLTIPGVNDIYIAALHVATEGRADQLTCDQFKAVCGVNPKTAQSGSRSSSKITRKGYRPALNALWTWSMYLVSASAPENAVRAYHERKQDFYATRAKLARLVSNVARDPEGYRPPKKV